MPSFKQNDKEIEVADDAVVTVKIAGELKELPLKTIMEMASKVGGADAKFQEAARIKSEGQKGLRLIELSRKGESLTYDEFSELCGLSDVPPDQINQRWGIYQQAQTEMDDEEGEELPAADDFPTGENPRARTSANGGGDSPEVRALKEQMAQMNNTMQGMRGFLLKVAQERTNSDVNNLLTKDERLGKLNTEQRAVLAEVLEAEAARYIQEHPGEGYSLAALQHGLEAVKDKAGKLGLHSTTKDASSEKEVAEQLREIGLGPLGGGGGTSITLGEPPKRPSASDPGYEDWFAQSSIMDQAAGKYEEESGK